MPWRGRFVSIPGAIYHVMNRGTSRQKVFFKNRDYEASLTTIGELHDRWPVEVFAYCLMGQSLPCVSAYPGGESFPRDAASGWLYVQRVKPIESPRRCALSRRIQGHRQFVRQYKMINEMLKDSAQDVEVTRR